MTAPYWLSPDRNSSFPDVSLSLREPDGLLAVGGDLTVERLVTAYRSGIFPWYSDDQPILWWSPDPRSVLLIDELHISKSLKKTLRQKRFNVTTDHAFEHVINACSQPRDSSPGTWITDEMQQAYIRLHQAGKAHSVECWHDGKLVGGLYGVAVGKVFFGESMFSRYTDASKVAFVLLVQQLQKWHFYLIDCQIQSAHLDRFGANNISRNRFIELLSIYCEQQPIDALWHSQIS
jgi:leucyl/phenylalanyl-tRNA--protein transferase